VLLSKNEQPGNKICRHEQQLAPQEMKPPGAWLTATTSRAEKSSIGQTLAWHQLGHKAWATTRKRNADVATREMSQNWPGTVHALCAFDTL
jgi:hypothetical protein